jgi:secondary thiamine-phosphate synthase enzyme
LPETASRDNIPRRAFRPPQVTSMKILRTRIEFETADPIQILDITGQVRDWVATTGIREGLLTVTSLHTTARVNVNEREPQLEKDIVTWLKRFVPKDGDWLHNLVAVDGRDNAHSHILGLFMNSSETIPIAGGEMVLGSWQAIFFIELDGPRERRGLELQIMGVA